MLLEPRLRVLHQALALEYFSCVFPKCPSLTVSELCRPWSIWSSVLFSFASCARFSWFSPRVTCCELRAVVTRRCPCCETITTLRDARWRFCDENVKVCSPGGSTHAGFWTRQRAVRDLPRTDFVKAFLASRPSTHTARHTRWPWFHVLSASADLGFHCVFSRFHTFGSWATSGQVRWNARSLTGWEMGQGQAQGQFQGKDLVWG